jgi:LysM repeat protein
LIAAFAAIGTSCADLESPRAAAHHEVRSGETLGSIAGAYGIHLDQLARANGLRDADRISVGQRLVIPERPRLVHRVRPGETLRGIADRYGVRVSTIASLNRLGRWPQIEPGQRLVLPHDAKLPAVASAPPSATPRTAVQPRAPVPPAAVPVARAPDPDVERAAALVDRAVDDYLGARFERALARAREAEALLAQTGDRAAQRQGARAVFVAGSALAALGDSDRARDSFARVHTLDPNFEPPKGWLSPRLEALYLGAPGD